MALVLDDRFLPATLTVAPMTDEEFLMFCAEHPDLRFEMTAEGELIVMPPPYSFSGAQESEIERQLGNWAVRDGRGIMTNSNGSFVLPNGARRAPDAAWTLKAEVDRLHADKRKGYWHLSPAFVIELRSESDRLRTLRAKMAEYLENGVQLGWMLDLETRSVEIYRPGRSPERIENAETVAGEGPVEGFALDLRRVWDPFGA